MEFGLKRLPRATRILWLVLGALVVLLFYVISVTPQEKNFVYHQITQESSVTKESREIILAPPANHEISPAEEPVSRERRLVPSNMYNLYDPMDIKEPVPFLEGYRSPCFLQELTSRDPYKGVPHLNKFNGIRMQHVREVYAKRMQMEHPFRVRCMPAFFIAGVHKCGSTDLQAILPLHRQLMGFTVTENHWWNRQRFRIAQKEAAATVEGYLDLFDSLSERIYEEVKTNSTTGQHFHPSIFGDESPGLLWDQSYWRSMRQNENQSEPLITVAHTLHHVLPQAKFVIILRNPTSRLYSDWNYFGSAKLIGPLTAAKFHERVTEAIDAFNACIKTQPLRACYYDALTEDPKEANRLREKHQWWNSQFRLRMGMYYVFIKDLLDVFPRDQVFIFRLEDYSKNRVGQLQDIYSFLELDADPELAEKVRKQSVHNKKKATEPMLPETKEMLDTFYGEYNRKLADLLQDDAYLWK